MAMNRNHSARHLFAAGPGARGAGRAVELESQRLGRLLPSPVFIAWLLVAGDILFLFCVAAGTLP